MMITVGSKYPITLNRLEAMNLYSNCGFGVIQIPVRSDCSQEVTLVTLFYGGEISQPERSDDNLRCECKIAIQVCAVGD